MIVLLSSAAMAGPWTKEQGQHYVKAGADWYTALEYAQPAEGSGLGSTGDAGTEGFFGHQYSVYGEFGLSKGHPIQIGARVPLALSYVQFKTEDAARLIEGKTFTMRGGDFEITPQVALSRKIPVAAAVTVKIPLYGVDSICQNNMVYRDFCGRPGDGQTDFTFWTLAGGSLLNGKAWVEGWAGYRHRTEFFRNWDTERDLVDSVVFAGTFGAKAGPLIAMARVDGNKNIQKDAFTAEAVRIGPALMLQNKDGWALEGRLAWEPWAENASRGIGFGTGVSWTR